MKLYKLRQNWERFGQTDPYWAILTNRRVTDEQCDIQDFFASGQREIRQLMAYLNTLSISLGCKHALDFGCGVGRLTQALAPHFERVTGLDIAASMIEIARRYNTFPDTVTYIQHEQAQLEPFADRTFDFIYSNITLQHIRPYYSRGYLQEFIRVLKPDGLLVFQLPAGIMIRDQRGYLKPLAILASLVFHLRLGTLYRRMKYGRRPLMELYFIPKAEVINLIERSGARLLDIHPDYSAGRLIESYRYTVTA